MHWGAPTSDLSLLNVMRYIKNLGGLEPMLAVEGGDQQDRFKDTAQSFAQTFADQLGSRVIVNAPVQRIITQDERRRRVVDHVVHLYGEAARNPIDYTDFSWGNDSFAPGGPNPAVGPKAWTTFGPFLREPVGRVHWAGTETADETSGTMNGAILSGQRAAREVTELLGQTWPKGETPH